jgi:hypothetical protein
LISLRPRAIHEILLGERNEGSSSDLVASFDGSSGGERPARTALLLILDGSDGSSSSPILGVREGRGSEGRDELGSRRSNSGHLESIEDGSEFSTGEVSKLVHLDGESVGGVGIVGVDEIEVSLEDGVSSQEFLLSVALVVESHPRQELSLVLRLRESRDGDSQKEGNQDRLHRAET